MTPITQALRTYRDRIRKACPPWLQTGLAEQWLYAAAVQIDAMADAVVGGIKLRFPGQYSYDSLPTIGRERRIRRGRTETDVVYSTRLARWFDSHARRGGPYAMLQQIYEFWAPNSFPVTLLNRSGARYQMDVAGVISRDEIFTYDTPQWAKWILLYESDALTAADAEDIAVVPRDWIAAHCIGDVMVLPTGGELWNYPLGHLWDESGTWDTVASPFRVTIVGGV